MTVADIQTGQKRAVTVYEKKRPQDHRPRKLDRPRISGLKTIENIIVTITQISASKFTEKDLVL